MVTTLTMIKMITRPPAAVKDAAVMGSKVGAAMEGARRATQAKKIKPWWQKIDLKLKKADIYRFKEELMIVRRARMIKPWSKMKLKLKVKYRLKVKVKKN